MQTPILGAVIALVLWSVVMLVWLVATRIPASAKLKLNYDPMRPKSEYIDQLPPKAQWKADNYNHLMEQPTLFYATAITLALLGAGGGLNAKLAWAYVALRIIHSLVQATVNKLPLRFLIFLISSVVLAVMAVRAAMIIFNCPAA